MAWVKEAQAVEMSGYWALIIGILHAARMPLRRVVDVSLSQLASDDWQPAMREIVCIEVAAGGGIATQVQPQFDEPALAGSCCLARRVRQLIFMPFDGSIRWCNSH